MHSTGLDSIKPRYHFVLVHGSEVGNVKTLGSQCRACVCGDNFVIEGGSD